MVDKRPTAARLKHLADQAVRKEPPLLAVNH